MNTYDEFLPTVPKTTCTVNVVHGDSISTQTYDGTYVGNNQPAYDYNVNTYDSTAGAGCSKYNYNWSAGLGTNSYFALLTGET